MKTIAVIPARGGSKRIPQKNIMNFMGRPLIAWTIEAAQASGIFDRIVVSTDDTETARIAAGLGVEMPFLRSEASDDLTPVSVATIVAVKQAQEYWNEEYDVVIQLMANCPIRGSRDISTSYKHFVDSSANFQLSCFKFGWMNPWWATKLDENFVPEFIFPEALKKRSQDLPELYCPTGAIWIARVGHLLNSQTFYGDGHRFFPIDWKSAVDIDNYEDVEFAEVIHSLVHKQRDVA
ncbi:cytidylyltransferase domain-containing protein [Geobacter sp.]|uniref:acylneuraminate cytidylyltransferase family protein n=1 Tax=Geobacter sp. TaxID=46610 RepID=UPI0027BAFC87|nr:acylneuraminate cytidylyltransferase family protein [Geobacter sp.]